MLYCSPNQYLLDLKNNTTKNEGESKLNFEELLNVVNRLEEYLRVPFMMVYKGFKYEEIAEKLRIPVGTVKSRIFLARKRIKAFIQHHYRTFRKDKYCVIPLLGSGETFIGEVITCLAFAF